MSDQTTRRMMSAYYQEPIPTMFLTSMFQTRPENVHNSEEIEIDIERCDEDIAIVITDLSTGYRMNSKDIYTNKSFKPPIYKEAIPLNAFDMIKRQVGQNPFQDPDYRANVIMNMMRGMRDVEKKIRRSIELQGVQILTSGVLTLTDALGNALYALDYQPKATHFPTTGTSWATSTALQKQNDIISLATIIRQDGKMMPDQLIFGEGSWVNFINTTGIQTLFDIRRLNIADLPRQRRMTDGGVYHGTCDIGNYTYDLWTYDGFYKDPQTGNVVKYLADDKLIVRSSMGRMDATWGGIPNIARDLGIGRNLIPELPSRFTTVAGGMDMFTHVWLSPDGEQLFGGVGSRPLLIPTAIDTFGCLDTIP